MTISEAIAMLGTMATFPDAAGSKAAWIAIMQAAGPVDPATFVPGDPSERFLEIGGRAMGAWGVVPTQAARGLFLHLQTDPGDVDDFGDPDLSADQTPRPGFLSALGLGWFGVERGAQTYATSFVTVQNDGDSPATFAPGQITAEASGIDGTPVYVNTPDASLYTGFNSTITIGAGQSAVLPFEAQQIGSASSAGVNEIDVIVTQTYGTLSATASTLAIGQERQPRLDYIAECEIAGDKLAPGGPTQSYRFAMRRARDGSVLQRYNGSGPVSITSAQITIDSATGIVNAYFADIDGAADAVDVRSANDNIQGVVDGVITDPLGIVPDCVTYTGIAAINTTVAVTYSARIKASAVSGGASAGTYTSGGSPPAPIAAIFQSVADALGAYLPALGPGALEQDSGGNGKVYTADLQDVAKESATGLYGVAVTTPGTSTTAITLGHVPIAGTISGTLVVVAG